MASKLYVLLVSNTSRPIRALIAENKLPIEEVALDFYKGEHASEPYISLNPNGLVPTLDDDGFVLTESSAIMKYLADKYNLPSYPKDLKKRAKVMMMTIFIGSEGWMLKTPRSSQRVAPMVVLPTSSTSTRRISTAP